MLLYNYFVLQVIFSQIFGKISEVRSDEIKPKLTPTIFSQISERSEQKIL